ncbi:hypothetical protein H8356DRAFT_1346983 [Neocallimastix lanati (nom. inval.)]|nr:hypothetical protein H8356DRAFT_1346983 [Neocallimastix sp. JGI-2020a]
MVSISQFRKVVVLDFNEGKLKEKCSDYKEDHGFHKLFMRGYCKTDISVHTIGLSVFHFDSDITIPYRKYKNAINYKLPNDIYIVSLELFHGIIKYGDIMENMFVTFEGYEGGSKTTIKNLFIK